MGSSRIGLIDKAFLIAQPMRKADWTRRFAAGWGSAGMPMAIVEGNQTVRAALARENDREITPGARSGIATASFGAGEIRYNRFFIGVSGYFPVGVTAPPTGDIRRAAASGNCHSGDIVVTLRQGPAPR